MEIPDSCEPLLTIGIAARKLGVSESTLRLYEREGLLISFRTETGRRLYSINDLKVVDLVRKLIQEHGLNFAGVRALFSQLPCWKIKNCREEDRAECERFRSALVPCWRLGGTACGSTPEQCRTCPVYVFLEKSLLPGWGEGNPPR